MKPESSYEQLERRRRHLRGIILTTALVFIVAGVACLAVPPETPMESAIARAFWGIGLLVVGFIVGLCSRIVS